MLVNFMSWATLLTIAVATSFSNHYSTRTSILYYHHGVTTSATYNHYSTITSGISFHNDVSISALYSYYTIVNSVPYTIVSSVPYPYHDSATMIGSSITSTIYSSRFKVSYSYIKSSTKYPSSMTSEPSIRPTGSHTEPMASYSYIGSPFSSTTISHSSNVTKLPTISSTNAATTHFRYDTTAIAHSEIPGTISKSLIRPTDSHTKSMASYSFISTTISHSTNMTKLPAVSLTKASTTYSGHDTTALNYTAITSTISRSLVSLTINHIVSSTSRTLIASPVSSVNALHSASMTSFPTSHSVTSIIPSILASYVNKSIDKSYSYTALPTKSYYVTSCVVSGTRCFSSQFSSLVTTLPISNLIYQTSSMISVSNSSSYISKIDDGDINSPTKASKDAFTATFGQPQDSGTRADSHLEAASSRYCAPIFLLFSQIIILVVVLL